MLFRSDTTYAVVGGLEPGRQAEVIGKSADAQWWNVRNPNDPSTECWLAADLVTVTGPASELVLYAYGRQQHSKVELSGDDRGTRALQDASLGL